jgi:hypothetical protein
MGEQILPLDGEQEPRAVLRPLDDALLALRFGRYQAELISQEQVAALPEAREGSPREA